jgi:hypothetical protein
MDNAEEHRASVSFGPPRLQKFEPSTTLAGEEEVASRLDSLIEMEDNWDNMFVFTNNMVDRSFDLDEEADEDTSYFTEDDSCFAPVGTIVAPTPNSTQPPELPKPHTVTMDNTEEHRASVCLGPQRLQKFEPSTTLAGEEEVASRVDSLSEMEDNCDKMFAFTNNMVDRSCDLDKEDDEDNSYFAGEQSCFASVGTVVAPTPNFTQPPELLKPRTVTMDNAEEYRASVFFRSSEAAKVRTIDHLGRRGGRCRSGG